MFAARSRVTADTIMEVRSVVVAIAIVALAERADAEPIHVAALAIGGFWLTGHGYGEKQLGAEVAVERDLGDIYRVGVGTEIVQFKINDDECYGSTGQFTDAFASGGLREPIANTVHLFIAARLGIRGARMVPSCFPQAPIRYDAFTFGAIATGVDVGNSHTRARVQISLRHSSVPNAPVEIELGLGAAF
jgi:hypothetical protein